MNSSLLTYAIFTAQVLVIDSVKESDLGLYQCIARTLTPDGRTDEWVSATALLSLYSDKIVTKGRLSLFWTPFEGDFGCHLYSFLCILLAADLAEFIPNVHRMPTSHPEGMEFYADHHLFFLVRVYIGLKQTI